MLQQLNSEILSQTVANCGTLSLSDKTRQTAIDSAKSELLLNIPGRNRRRKGWMIHLEEQDGEQNV